MDPGNPSTAKPRWVAARGTGWVDSIGRAANGKLDYRTLTATATTLRATRPVEENRT